VIVISLAVGGYCARFPRDSSEERDWSINNGKKIINLNILFMITIFFTLKNFYAPDPSVVG